MKKNRMARPSTRDFLLWSRRFDSGGRLRARHCKRATACLSKGDDLLFTDVAYQIVVAQRELDDGRGAEPSHQPSRVITPRARHS
jgi:hypothetical protein